LKHRTDSLKKEFARRIARDHKTVFLDLTNNKFWKTVEILRSSTGNQFLARRLAPLKCLFQGLAMPRGDLFPCDAIAMHRDRDGTAHNLSTRRSQNAQPHETATTITEIVIENHLHTTNTPSQRSQLTFTQNKCRSTMAKSDLPHLRS
jgi:hypothetical protein